MHVEKRLKCNRSASVELLPTLQTDPVEVCADKGMATCTFCLY